MNSLSLIAPIGLLLIGLASLFYICKIIYSAISKTNFFQTFLRKIHSSKFDKIDALIEQEKLKEAFFMATEVFIFDISKIKVNNLQALFINNSEVFKRIVKTTEVLNPPVKEIPIIEELISSRASLSKSFVEASLTKSSIKKSNSNKNWALDEYNNRINDLKDKLQTNSRSLTVQIDSLKQKMQSSQNESLTYH
ncbi:MAG: hypothetical protein KDD56_05300 [Bdellovibrionales bacterium]|nr:hypothetical protein [Bdellovibrionales bacterium]